MSLFYQFGSDMPLLPGNEAAITMLVFNSQLPSIWIKGLLDVLLTEDRLNKLLYGGIAPDKPVKIMI